MGNERVAGTVPVERKVVVMKPRMGKQEWAEQSRARVEAAFATLQVEVDKLVTGEDWTQSMDHLAHFHGYSPNNVMLLIAQHAERFRKGLTPDPTPSFMAGFTTWLQLGRRVNKGERGYVVLAPLVHKTRTAVSVNGETRRLGRGEQPKATETEKDRSGLRGFKVEHVFEANQTSGAPLPEVPHPKLLEGEAPEGLGAAVMGLIESAGYSVDTVPDARAIGGANGQTSWTQKCVLVREDMDDAAMVKTLLHECGHVLLHAEGTGALLARSQQEVEAESIAYVVAHAHGMGTENYSFPYVAHWAASADAEQTRRRVRGAQSRVAAAAKLIIAASPAPHVQGGRVPASAIQAAQAERAARAERTAEPAALTSDAIEGAPARMGIAP